MNKNETMERAAAIEAVLKMASQAGIYDSRIVDLENELRQIREKAGQGETKK